MKNIRKLFFTGLFVLIPLIATVSIIIWFFLKIDLLFRKPIQAFTGESFVGLGIILTIGLVLLTGFLATNYFGKRIISKIEDTIHKIPIANVIYTSIKQLQDTVFYKKNTNTFKSVVLAEYPSKGIYTLGFVTGVAPALIEGVVGKKMTSIFIPTTPNPTSGMYVMIPESDYIKLDIPVDTAIKLIVSAGILSPDFSSKLDSYEDSLLSNIIKKREGDSDE